MSIFIVFFASCELFGQNTDKHCLDLVPSMYLVNRHPHSNVSLSASLGQIDKKVLMKYYLLRITMVNGWIVE